MGLKSTLRNYRLKKDRTGEFKPRDYPGFSALRSLAIIFEKDDKLEEELMNFVEALKQQGKEVHLLAFIPKRRKELEKLPEYPFVCKNEVRWNGKSRSTAVAGFLNNHYQVFIDALQSEEHSFDIISNKVTADFKIGLEMRNDMNYDLILKTSNEQKANLFKEIDYYLKFINSKK